MAVQNHEKKKLAGKVVSYVKLAIISTDWS
jgi:hypothetical protein